VFCQLEVLRRCFPPDISRVLNELPEMLGKTYERILMEIGNEKREYARRLLQCLAVAIRPLRVEELAEILAVDFDTGGAIPKLHLGRRQEDQEADILSTCSSLVTVVNIDGSKVVQLSHFSVKAFLTSDRLNASSGRVSFYHASLETAHTILAQACLSVLLRLEDHLYRDSLEKIPLAEYAAKHWVDHARFENVAFHVQERMELLFDPEKPYFANWLRIYDIDDPLGLPTPHLIRPNAAPLYYAALCGLPSLAERLIVKRPIIERPMYVNARGGHYVTAIQAALYKRHLSIVRVLMEHGVDVNSRDDEGLSLLHIAEQIGDPEAVSLLMSRGADVGSGHSSMLFMALNSGNLAETRLLLDRGVDANTRDEKGSTALHISSDNGYLELVRLLLQYGAEVDSRDNHGSTPLHLASAKGDHRVVSLLMEHGADVNALDKTNSTPLHLAFINQDLGIAAFLIKRRANVKVLDDRVLDNKPLAPLHLALSNGNTGLVDLLVRRGIDVNGRDNNYMAPLHLASAKGNHTAVESLIDHGAEVNALDNTNSTPLHLALINENFDIALLLIKKSAHVKVEDNKKLTPLHLALLNKNFNLVDLLIGLGADVNACSNDNSTPLHVASRDGHRKFVDLLLEHGGDPNLRNDSGFSPLHIASLQGDVNIAESLLDGGAKANLKDWNRKTPLHLASNNKKMARLLIRHGADAFALDNKDAMPLRYGEDVEREGENTVTLGSHI
jgi:ankyrin repeat protein